MSYSLKGLDKHSLQESLVGIRWCLPALQTSYFNFLIVLLTSFKALLIFVKTNLVLIGITNQCDPNLDVLAVMPYLDILFGEKGHFAATSVMIHF